MSAEMAADRLALKEREKKRDRETEGYGGENVCAQVSSSKPAPMLADRASEMCGQRTRRSADADPQNLFADAD